MCGIAAYFGEPDPRACAVVRRMLRAQRHRGPDGAGLAAWLDRQELFFQTANSPDVLPGNENTPASCVLGHNWLAIQDRSDSARQPMRLNLALTFNGEIYNFVELRAELESQSVTFDTGSDTEVLLKLWEREGAACLRKLRGMYAFAALDRVNQTLDVVRDPFGIKPLYYARTRGGVYVASEIRALHVEGLLPRRLRSTAAIACAAAGINNFQSSLYDGISELPPGTLMSVTRRSGLVESYVDPYVLGGELTGDKAVAQLRSSLDESVRMHLRSSRKQATCLSGGLDSTNLAWTIGKHLADAGGDFCAYTINTSGQHNSEIDAAQAVTRAAGIRHEIYEPAEIAPRNVIEMAVAIEQPNHVIGPINQFLLLRRIAESGAAVVLDGQGGDELLSGYPWFAPVLFGELRKRGRDPSELIAKRNARPPLPLWQLEMFDKMFHDPVEWVRAFMTHPEFLGVTEQEILALPETEYYLQGGDWAAFFSRQVYRAELQYLLRQEDRLGMHFGLECRVPFVDKELFALTRRFDPEFLIHDGWLKYAFRVMYPEIPESIRWCTTKRGYWETERARFEWVPEAARKLAFDSSFLRCAFPKLEAQWGKLHFDQHWRILQLALLERCATRAQALDVAKELGF